MSAVAQKYALVTGAYTGIGFAICEALAKRGYGLLMVARNQAGLQEAAATLEAQFKVPTQYLPIDLTETDAAQRVEAWVNDLKLPLAFLVNNAGFGWDGSFTRGDLHHFDRMLQLNMRVVLQLTHRLLPKLAQGSEAYVLNVSSMAVYGPLPYKVMYSATKSFAYQFTRSLAMELEIQKSTVSASVLCAGPVPTTETLAKNIAANGWMSRRISMPAQAVGEIGVRDTLRRKTEILPGFWPQLGLLVLRLTPTWLRARTFKKRLGRFGDPA